MCEYVKEQIQEQNIEKCKEVIKFGGSLELVLNAFKEIDETLIRDLFAQFSPKAVK